MLPPLRHRPVLIWYVLFFPGYVLFESNDLDFFFGTVVFQALSWLNQINLIFVLVRTESNGFKFVLVCTNKTYQN